MSAPFSVVKSKRNWIWSNRNRKRKQALESDFGLAENQNWIFGFGLGYAEIGCLAQISAKTEIKDNFSAEIGYSGEGKLTKLIKGNKSLRSSQKLTRFNKY